MLYNIVINVIMQTLITLTIIGIFRRRVRLANKFGQSYFSSGKKNLTGNDAILIGTLKLIVFLFLYYIAFLYNPLLSDYLTLFMSMVISIFIVFLIWKFNLFY
jgi:hypothetical protein